MEENLDDIGSFLERFPSLVGAYGYGSGVFKQANTDSQKKPQVDLILVVDNLENWHSSNLSQNPNDYSNFSHFLGNFKTSKLVDFYYGFGVPVMFHPYIFDQREYKYGVVSKDDFSQDLVNWSNFYFAGRFQKPVKVFNSDDSLDSKLLRNRVMAAKTALLLGDKQSSLEDFFTQIVALSYIGDVRMKCGENPCKVRNIVEGNYDGFKEIYLPILDDLEIVEVAGSQVFQGDLDVLNLINGLPLNFRMHFSRETGIALSEGFFDKKEVLSFFKKVNTKSTLPQTLKGFFSAGRVRTNRYLSEKFEKAGKQNLSKLFYLLSS